MDEKKLVEILERKFATKDDHEVLRQEVRELKTEVRTGFEEINEKLDDLKASANAVDKILEANPVPRIERLEHHVGLPPFTPAHSEE